MKPPQTITLAFTGASGMPYGLRVLECLIAARCRVYLIYSPAAQVVAKQECDLVLPAQPREAARMFSERYGARDGQLQVFAAFSSRMPTTLGASESARNVSEPTAPGVASMSATRSPPGRSPV